ncbi:hypothetical protein FOA52_013728 [Chlamydomonas sp. UWO 241]|nr:hypothetical protein FOA52_013728 [Chlamydomonas sp. UWO 241]
MSHGSSSTRATGSRPPPGGLDFGLVVGGCGLSAHGAQLHTRDAKAAARPPSGRFQGRGAAVLARARAAAAVAARAASPSPRRGARHAAAEQQQRQGEQQQQQQQQQGQQQGHGQQRQGQRARSVGRGHLALPPLGSGSPGLSSSCGRADASAFAAPGRAPWQQQQQGRQGQEEQSPQRGARPAASDQQGQQRQGQAGEPVGDFDWGEESARANERLVVFRRAADDKARAAADEEASRRRAAAGARDAARTGKERHREETYAMNAVLAMCEQARIDALLAAAAACASRAATPLPEGFGGAPPSTLVSPGGQLSSEARPGSRLSRPVSAAAGMLAREGSRGGGGLATSDALLQVRDSVCSGSGVAASGAEWCAEGGGPAAGLLGSDAARAQFDAFLLANMRHGV